MRILTAALIMACIGSSVSTHAQERALDEALADTKILQGLAIIDESSGLSAQTLVQIGGIISPSGQEHERAAAVAELMRSIGLEDVQISEAPNVTGRIPGRSGKALVFVSTLDDLATVAEHQRAAGTPPVIDGNRVVGPGTNTSLTTVAMLSAARALLETGITPEHDLVFASVAEEETGLRGMHALYADYRDQALAFVDILGEGSTLSYGALGIHWWRIHAHGPAGHTLNGGLPNVNQAIGRAVDRIFQIREPQLFEHRRTRLNVAVLNSGAVFNHKPETGWFSLDVRSLDPEHIESMESQVRHILDEVTAELGITFNMEEVSRTPPGQIDGALDSSLVQTSVAISDYLGSSPALSNAGSANLNVSIAGGTLSIGISSERGGRRGFPDEWADIDVMQRTAKHIFLLAVTQANAD
ncbi:M20/M25/M40 family metallo-hydrolase [Pseudohongiella spirulinae]|uniref:Di-and tripeptidase n=1 Tax=Pseudohongiella spirulinae TaxID=1249552 RepID=A0A0S2KC59_9GAMM|nr:M20/M25/M40 family metallo-hydrolase [Pseudohongiella spirulinae]ALO45538.1 Di-and tripeptidase [Pseudohongiella spirulinae]